MNVWLLPIEAHEQRYTEQWRRYLPEQLAQAAADRKIEARFPIMNGDMPDQQPTAGAFLDFAGTNVFKSTQIAEVARRFQRNEVQPGDVFLFTDAWHPGVHQVRYMSALCGVPVRIVGLWHAGHYDPNDFLGRIKVEDAPWARAMEQALFEAYDVSAFATRAHIDLFRKGVSVREEEGRPAQVGWPMEYLGQELKEAASTAKENIVLFPHRVAREKQADIFRDLAREFPDWQFEVCQDRALTKAEYHKLLGRSRVVFSCSLQETLGIGCYEGVLAGAVPVVPDRLSYREMYPEGFRYPSDWTANWEAYLRHKPKLVVHLREVLARAAAGSVDLEPCRQRLAPFFSGGQLYDWVFAKPERISFDLPGANGDD
jgi:hypothetical protein